MGSQDVAGWVFIAAGTLNTSHAFRPVVQARRRGTGSAWRTADVWFWLLVGLIGLLTGVFYIRYPSYPHGSLSLIPQALSAVVLILMVGPWILSRRRARRLGPNAVPTLGPSSVDMPRPSPAYTPDASTAALIERIKNVTFSTVRMVPGYDEKEVDIFLDKLVAALGEDGQLDRSQLRDVTFSTTRLRPGYAMPDVDTFLEEVAQATW